jgi:hypothetical protein
VFVHLLDRERCGAASGAAAETCALGIDGVAAGVKPGVDSPFGVARDWECAWRGHRERLESSREVSEEAMAGVGRVFIERPGIVLL